jgi:hypothetical protein
MAIDMKTTIDLPDDLLIAAKKRAAELRRPLRRIIEDGLRASLRTGRRGKSGRPARIRWITVAGGLPPGLDLSDRTSMIDWIQRNK